MGENQQNQIIEFHLLPLQIQKQIYDDWFCQFKRRRYCQWSQAFDRYLIQKVLENQDEQDIGRTFQFQNYQLSSPNLLSEIIVQQHFSQNQYYYYLMGSFDSILFENEKQEKKRAKICDITNRYLFEFHFEVSLPCGLNDTNLEKLKSQFQNPLIFKQLTKKIEQINQNNLLMRDISNSNLSSYLINNNIVKLCQSQSNLFAFEQNHEGQIRFFSVKIKNQDCIEQITQAIIKIQECNFEVIVFPNNQRQYTDNQDNSVQFQLFIRLYDVILEQLKYENKEWILNLENNDYKFYKKVDKYPQFFYLKPEQTLIAQCSNSNVKISYIP